MAHLTLDDLLTSLTQLKATHGGTLPLWLATPAGVRVLPAWATDLALVPLVGLQLCASVQGSPAVLFLGLGTGLEASAYGRRHDATLPHPQSATPP